MSLSRFLTLTSLVLVASLTLRISAAWWWQARLDARGQQFAMGDSDSYWYLARTIATGEPYQYGSPDAAVFRAPGYPYLLSWVVDTEEATRGVLAARIMGAMLGTATVGLVILAGCLVWDRHVALMAGVLASIYPGAIVMSLLVLSEAPFQLLMLGTLVCLLVRAQQLIEQEWSLTKWRPEWWAIGGGVIAGIGALTRPSWMLFPPFFFGCRVLFSKYRLTELRGAICFGAVMALTMSPWWIRNYQVTGHFVPTTLQVGPSLYDGLHADASGASDTGMDFSITFANQLREEDKVTIERALAQGSPAPKLESFEYRLNRKLATAATTWAKQHPGEVVRLGFIKLYRTWWPWPVGQSLPGANLARHAIAGGMLMIFLPSLWWIVNAFRRTWKVNLPAMAIWFIFVAPTLYFGALHAIFVGSARYRQPALLALTLLAAHQYILWWRSYRHNSPPEIATDTEVLHGST